MLSKFNTLFIRFFYFLLFFSTLSPCLFAWEIENYENDVRVHENGITTLTETLQVDFQGEDRHGIYRSIPMYTKSNLGQRVKTRLQVRQVTDGKGRAWPYQVVFNNFYLMIRIGHPDHTLSGKQTYQIVYDVERGAIRFFKDHDEFFWNLIGTDWDVPIRNNLSRIQIPNAAQGIRVIAYQGFYGSQTSVRDLKIQDHQITVRSNTALRPREGLTVAVAWDKGLIQPPPVSVKIKEWLEDNGIYGMPVVVLLLMLWLWYQKGRDFESGNSIAVEYEAPAGLTPAEVGTLIDQKADLKDITATLIDLAVRGYLKIEELKKGILDERDYLLTKLKSWEDSDLKPHEKEILSGVFKASKSSIKLSELNEKFQSRLYKIKKKIYQGLIKDKLFDADPETIRLRYTVFGLFAWMVLFFVPRVLISEYHLFTVPLLIAAFLSGLIIIIIGIWMPRRTIKGANLMGPIRGFSEFLKRADSDRIRRMNDPTLFERCLPFAMALGFADQWARAFEGIFTEPPSWYVGYGNNVRFSSRSFASDMRNVSSSMNETLGSAARSSGSSSRSGFSSGGGFSGGGGGGGGGGAW